MNRASFTPSFLRSGFTIVELLIVIVVIAILAAISVVAYQGIQERSLDSAIRSDLANFKKKMELLRVDDSGDLYPAILTSAMGFSFTKSAYKTNRYNLYYCVTPDRTRYALGVVARTRDTQGYLVSNSTNVIASTNVWAVTTCSSIGMGEVYSAGFQNPSTWASWTN